MGKPNNPECYTPSSELEQLILGRHSFGYPEGERVERRLSVALYPTPQRAPLLRFRLGGEVDVTKKQLLQPDSAMLAASLMAQQGRYQVPFVAN
jgi:hypothetical protein